MIIKLLAQQIPAYWENIKFATTEVDSIKGDNLQPYLNELLHSLLNNKAQCFIKFDDKKTLIRLMVTEIRFDKFRNEKYLLIQCLYSFVGESDINTWKKDWQFIKQFADKEECAYISFETSNERICEIGKAVGFKERYKSFVLR